MESELLIQDQTTGQPVAIFWKDGSIRVRVGSSGTGSEQEVEIPSFSNGLFAELMSGFRSTIDLTDKSGREWRFKVSTEDADKWLKWRETPPPIRGLIPGDLKALLVAEESGTGKFFTILYSEIAERSGQNAVKDKGGVVVGLSEHEVFLCRQTDDALPIFASNKTAKLQYGQFTVLEGSGDASGDKWFQRGGETGWKHHIGPVQNH